MKKYILHILLALIALGATHTGASAQSDNLFPYPVPPDTMMSLQPRCDYIISRFWDRCNFETAMLDKDRLNRTFGDWVSIMQHASADTVHAAIDKLLGRFVKKGPETLELATLAENWLYSDTASIFSQEAYLPFARAAAHHKKLSKTERARFQLHEQIIESSGLGAIVPNLEFIRPDGTKGHLHDINAESILLFINDPDCDDCSVASTRLGVDYNAAQLIERGELAIISIYPDEPDDRWRAEAERYPQTWTVGAIKDADTYFDLRSTPLFLFLDGNHKVSVNVLNIDQLLTAFRNVNIRHTRRQ